MIILFANDDGYNSIGLHAVANLFKNGSEITVVASDCQKSGASRLNIDFSSYKPRGIRITRMKTRYTFAYGDKSIDCDALRGDHSKLNNDNDENYCLNGYLTVTPLLINRTDFNALNAKTRTVAI